ncbi:MAG TPA: radical SAM protein [Syntrophobacteraceae bacterium]|nr:radical SAM protein [Syntrophobacteraceae bacterium]
MSNRKRVLLVSYYGKVCLSTKILSGILRRAGHETCLIYLKDDRSTQVESVNKASSCFQFICSDRGAAVYGTGMDVNPIRSTELDLLVNKALEFLPDVVAISSRSVHIEVSRVIIMLLRKVLPKATRYIAGGYGPSLEPEKFLEVFDYVCIGRGDSAVLDLVEKEDPSSCRNVATLVDGKLHIAFLDNQVDLNLRPFADWNFENKFLIEDGKIFPLHEKYDPKTYGIIASEGCPSSCTYCQASQWPHIYRLHGGRSPKVVMRKPDNVIAELIHAKDHFGIESVQFMDSIFTWHRKWFDEFMALYNRHVALPFCCYTDARFTSRKQLVRLKESGMFSTTVGIQSVDEESRRKVMGRRVSNERIIEFAWEVVELGIVPTYDIIVWNPFETEESLARGVDLLRQLPKSNRIFIYELKILPRSLLEDLFNECRPTPLSQESYMYWSWIFVMLLRSDATQEAVPAILSNPIYKDSPHLIRERYLEILGSQEVRERLFAIRPVAMGEMLRPTMFIEKASLNLEGVLGEDRHYITGKTIRRPLRTGEVLCYKDFYTSYQEK